MNRAYLTFLVVSFTSMFSSVLKANYWENDHVIPASKTYTNPVTDFSCPDPTVLVDGDNAFLSCTRGSFPIYDSPNFVEWDYVGRTNISYHQGGEYGLGV